MRQLTLHKHNRSTFTFISSNNNITMSPYLLPQLGNRGYVLVNKVVDVDQG